LDAPVSVLATPREFKRGLRPLSDSMTKSLSLSLYKREKLPSYYVSPFVKGD
jgi:hypothetical protein